MTTYTQTNTLYSFLSEDNNKSLIISQDGLTLKSNLLTNNPMETIITPLEIIDVNSGNSITMERLTYLPTGLAALEAPLNSKMLRIQDTLLVDKTVDNELDPNSTTVAYNSIVLTDGTTTNSINKNGYTTKNTITNATHYLNFSNNLDSGISSINKTLNLSCNPSTGTINATTFSGTATNATNATNVLVTSDNTNGTYYIPFTKTSGTGNKLLYIDDIPSSLSYNPITSTLTANTFNIMGTPATASVASTFGQVGLVKLQTLSGIIIGSISTTDFNLNSCFNSSYRNYRIIISSKQVAFAAYPSYALKAFLGTGTLPTVASLYGFEIKNNASTPIYSTNTTISTNPLIFDVSSIPNKQIIFDIKNVGFLNTSSNQVTLYCKSEYNNLVEQGISDRTITTTSLNTSTITGLTIQQSAIGLCNNMNWSATIYGYNLL